MRSKENTLRMPNSMLRPGELYYPPVSEGQPEMKPGGITKHVVYLQVRLKV